MRLLACFAALCAAAPIAGCQTTLNSDIAQFNAAVANDVPTACALVSSTWAAYQTVAATGTVSASDQKTAAAAYARASSICANAGKVDAATALQTLASAYTAIVQARGP
jgi:hypothetical protein